MSKEQIVERATVLANRIRSNRVRLQKDAGALSLFNNLLGEVISFLKEIKSSLDNGNLELAADLLLKAENGYSRFTTKKGVN